MTDEAEPIDRFLAGMRRPLPPGLEARILDQLRERPPAPWDELGAISRRTLGVCFFTFLGAATLLALVLSREGAPPPEGAPARERAEDAVLALVVPLEQRVAGSVFLSKER